MPIIPVPATPQRPVSDFIPHHSTLWIRNISEYSVPSPGSTNPSVASRHFASLSVTDQATETLPLMKVKAKPEELGRKNCRGTAVCDAGSGRGEE